MNIVSSKCKTRVFARALKNMGDEVQTSDQEEKMADFSEIFEKYFDKVYQFFFFRLRNETEAEDLASETFEKILKNLNRYEERGHGISAWIFTIARNVLNDYFRKNKTRVESIDELTPSKEPAKGFDLDKVDSEILKEKLWAVINTLPRKQQELWSFKLVEDLPHKEIAIMMETTEANVNVMLHRSIKTIKQQLSHLADE